MRRTRIRIDHARCDFWLAGLEKRSSHKHDRAAVGEGGSAQTFTYGASQVTMV